MAGIPSVQHGRNLSPIFYNSLPSLNAKVPHIRIFELSPGLLDAPIEGTLVVVPFQAKAARKPEYECLSYTWGDASDMASIHVDGNLMPVTRNLHTALRRFRSTDRVRSLWIDAICINQENDQEKSQQVGLMQQIYEDANRVLVWLGETEEGSDRAFAIFRRLLTSLGPVALKKWRARKALAPGAELPISELMPWEYDQRVAGHDQYYHSPLFESLRSFDVFAMRLLEWLPKDAAPQESDHIAEDGNVTVPVSQDNQLTATLLMARPYFTRVWIVQEIAVAKQALICCGNDELDWWLLNLALGYLMTSEKRAAGNEAGLQRFTSISLTRHSMLAQNQSLGSSPISVGLATLQHYRCCGATDKRDKIYALLGVIKHMGVDMGILPDYGIESRELYIGLARRILQLSKNLDILAIAHGRDESLPSWVPDWSNDNPQPNVLIDLSINKRVGESNRKAFDASAGSNIGAQITSQDDRLSLRGYQYDTLSHVGPAFRWMDGDRVITRYNHLLYNWLQTREEDAPESQEFRDLDRMTVGIPLEFWKTMRQWHTIGTDGAFDPYPFTGETAETALIRTLEGDHLPGGIEQPARHWKHLWNSLDAAIQAGSRLLNGNSSGDDADTFMAPAKLPGTHQEWDAPLYGPSNRRRLARTHLGYLALVGQDAKEGDSIFLLQGGRTPYILRRIESDYALVSDAYVHGIMHGEAWNAERCEDVVVV